MRIPVELFTIESDFREEREGLGDLALSIEKVGLLQPILVEDIGGVYAVRVGRSRFLALRDYLKLTHLEEGVHFTLKVGVDDLIAQLEENIQRKDFRPVEQARLVKAIHERGVEEHGKPVRGSRDGWSLSDTARLLRKNKSFVSKMLKIADNEALVASCASMSEALQKLEKEEEKRTLKLVQKARAKKVKTSDIGDFLSNYKLSDALTFLASIPDNSIDFILTDPPYGISLDKIVDAFDVYDDDPKRVKELIEACMPHFFRVIRDGKYMVLWCSFDFFAWTCDLAEAAGFFVPRVPIVWTKTGATGRSEQPDIRIGCTTECAVYAYSSPFARLTKPGRSNEFPHTPISKDKKIHEAQKPESLLIDILATFSVKGDLVLDTFAGSLSTARACWATGRNFIGCENREANYNAGLTYTMDWIEGKCK